MQQVSEIRQGQNYEEVLFVSVDLATKSLEKTEFYQCAFKNCHYNDSKVINCSFDSCTFEHCNFNMAVLTDTVIKACQFSNCTFVGVDFTKTRESMTFEPKFTNCNLSFSVFSGLKLMKSIFATCKLEEVDFSEAKMDESGFIGSDLTRTVFNHTDLRLCDFRGAHNYTIDPRNNFIKGAVFSEPDVMNLLQTLEIKIADPPEEGTES